MNYRTLKITGFLLFILLQLGHFGSSPVPEVDISKLNPSLQAILDGDRGLICGPNMSDGLPDALISSSGWAGTA